jgi:hypothetical protein
MNIKQTLQDEIQESKRWVVTAEGVELVNCVLENIKNSDINIVKII